MADHINPDDLPLVGLIEIAQKAGVKRNTVTSWRDRHDDFPEPVKELAVGPIFWWPHVRDWLVHTGRATDANWSRDMIAPESDYMSVANKVSRWATKIEKEKP